MLRRFYSQRKFAILLVATLLVIGTRLSVSGLVAEEVLIDVLGDVLLVTGLLTLCENRQHRLTALILGCPAILLALVSHGFPQEVARAVHLTSRVLTMLFLSFVVIMLVRTVVMARAVTWEAISAALVGYLMIGVVWTQIFCALELAQPGSFAFAGSSADPLDTVAERQAILEYFSFATLSTLGYGDVIPVSRPARSLACMEAICGQFYLAVLVAGLVGMRGIQPEPSQ